MAKNSGTVAFSNTNHGAMVDVDTTSDYSWHDLHRKSGYYVSKAKAGFLAFLAICLAVIVSFFNLLYSLELRIQHAIT